MFDANDDHRRKATSWAAGTLTGKGCKLYAVVDGWDVEYPDGSWAAANSWQELCNLASALVKGI